MEKTKLLLENQKIKVEEIESFGDKSPIDFWYNQEEGEFIYLTEGEGHLETHDGQIIKLKKGETFYINPHLKHRVLYTSKDCKWLCVFIKNN